MKKVLCVTTNIKGYAPVDWLTVGTVYEVIAENTVHPGSMGFTHGRMHGIPPGLCYRLKGVEDREWSHSCLFSDLPVAEDGYISVSEQIGRTAIARFNNLQKIF